MIQLFSKLGSNLSSAVPIFGGSDFNLSSLISVGDTYIVHSSKPQISKAAPSVFQSTMKQLQRLETIRITGTAKETVRDISSGETNTQLRYSFQVSHYPQVREQICDIGFLTKRGLLCVSGGGKSHSHLSQGRNDHSNRNPLDRQKQTILMLKSSINRSWGGLRHMLQKEPLSDMCLFSDTTA